MNVPERQVILADRAARRARAYLCSQLGLSPDADDDHIRAKDSAAVIPSRDQIITAAVEAALDDHDQRHWKRLGDVLGQALRRADGPTRQQVFSLLGLGDLD